MTDPFGDSISVVAQDPPFRSSLAYQLGYEAGLAVHRPPMTTWRGLCGHLWDRAVEDTDECPRCAPSPTTKETP